MRKIICASLWVVFLAGVAMGARGAMATTAPVASRPRMDMIDWTVFVVALAAIPASVWAGVRWWLRTRAEEVRRDWQSFWLIVTGLVCMVAIVCWYLIKFILPLRA